MNPNYKDVHGTVLIDPPDDMTFDILLTILRQLTEVTGVESGYEMTISCLFTRTMMFFHMTEQEADELRSRLEDIFGEDYVIDELHYAYDDLEGD